MSHSISTDSADSQKSASSFSSSVTVTCDDRWQVYHRLQALDIGCECSGFQPLKVRIKTPTELIQVRSVVQQVSSSRVELIGRLNRCWQLKSQ